MLCLLAKKVKEHKRKETKIMNPSLDFYFILFFVTTKCVKSFGFDSGNTKCKSI